MLYLQLSRRCSFAVLATSIRDLSLGTSKPSETKFIAYLFIKVLIHGRIRSESVFQNIRRGFSFALRGYPVSAVGMTPLSRCNFPLATLDIDLTVSCQLLVDPRCTSLFASSQAWDRVSSTASCITQQTRSNSCRKRAPVMKWPRSDRHCLLWQVRLRRPDDCFVGQDRK